MTFRDYGPGDVVSIRFAGVLRHYGVVTSSGTVISNSRKHGGVIEQSLTEFGAGEPIKWHGPESSLPGHVVEHRARRRKGERYDLTGSNCIDHVRHSHRKRPTPWLVGRAALMAVSDMLGPKRRY